MLAALVALGTVLSERTVGDLATVRGFARIASVPFPDETPLRKRVAKEAGR